MYPASLSAKNAAKNTRLPTNAAMTSSIVSEMGDLPAAMLSNTRCASPPVMKSEAYSITSHSAATPMEKPKIVTRQPMGLSFEPFQSIMNIKIMAQHKKPETPCMARS